MNLRNKTDDFPVIFIAIDGKGGSGKSTLANMLGIELGVGIIHTDDFTTFDRPAFNGSDLVTQNVFRPIQEGRKSLSYDRLQVWPGEPKSVIDQPVTELMIIEGCGVSCKKFRTYLSYIIVMDLDDETRIARCIERDVVEGGRSPEENEAIGMLWEKAEDEYYIHNDPRLRADIIVDSSEDYAISEIIKKLKQIGE